MTDDDHLQLVVYYKVEETQLVHYQAPHQTQPHNNQEHPRLAKLASALHIFANEWPELSMSVGMKAMQNHDEAGAASVDYLMYSGYVVLGYFHLKAALEADSLMQENQQAFSEDFLQHKIQLAHFYFQRILPKTATHKALMQADLSSLDPVWSDM